MKQRRKGFTIVELVVVIAVIGILAAVLIPTFSGLVKKAKLSVDQQALVQMNTTLSMAAATEEINSIEDVRRILAEAGYNPDSYIPLGEGTSFHWIQEAGVLALISDDTNTAIYPKEIAGNVYDSSKLVLLPEPEIKAPVAQVKFGANQPGMPATPTEIYGFEIKYIDLFTFRPVDEGEENHPVYSPIREEYKDWEADFQITINDNFDPYAVGICGSYLGIPWEYMVADFELEAGTTFSLLAAISNSENPTYFVGGIPYEWLVDYCAPDQNGDRDGFHCGAFDLSGENEGKSITVELRLYETDENGEATGIYVICEKIDYVFRAPSTNND